MILKPLDDVTLEDLLGLVSRKVCEGSQLDYKDALPGNDDRGKVEFLRDVTAMTNTDGGDLIYGLLEERADGEKTGVAGEVVGVEGLNFDERRLWMENLVRDNTEPRLVGVRYRAVPVDEAHTALIVRVPRSWNGPHVVSFGRHWRFYARNSGGNYPMDVTQLRDSFIGSHSVAEKIEAFRLARIETLLSDPRRTKAWTVLHIQPFESTLPSSVYDLSRLRLASEYFIQGTDFNTYATPKIRFNFDGIISTDRETFSGYVQLFRQGATEEVDTLVLDETDKDGQPVLEAVELERFLFKGVGRRLSLLKALGVSSPVVIHLSLLSVEGFRLKARRLGLGGYALEKILPEPIDRPNLLVPGVTIEDLQSLNLEGVAHAEHDYDVYNSWETAKEIVRPILDMVWNAAGQPRCLHYNQDGEWKGVMS